MRPSNDNPSDFLARIIPYVEQDGARNLNQISRELHIPYQTLRFRMMNLGQYGISVQASPDIQKIGLETVRITFKLLPVVKSAKSFLEELHRSAGLRSYAKSMFNRSFDCEFCVPLGTAPELQRMFLKLEKLGLVRDIVLKRILWKDLLELKTELFDYSKKEWSFDLRNFLAGEMDGRKDPIRIPKHSSLARFDYTDLLMVKELESNAWIKTVDLARKASLPVGDAAYHVNRHVFDRKLIKEFRLCWTGSREELANHSITVKTFVFAELSDEDESRRAISLFTSLPYTRSHMRAEDGTYFVDVAFPIERYPEASQMISGRLESMDLSPAAVLETDWSCTGNFTMPVSLFNKDQGVWIFRVEDAVERAVRSAKVKSR